MPCPYFVGVLIVVFCGRFFQLLVTSWELLVVFVVADTTYRVPTLQVCLLFFFADARAESTYFADDIFLINCTKWKVFRLQTAQNGKFLEASVNYFAWEEAFDVEDDVVGFEL